MKKTIIARTGGNVKITARRSGKAPPRFDVLVYSGIQLNIAGYELPVVVDLAGLSEGKVLVANLDHNPRQRVGTIEKLHNDGRRLRATGFCNAASPSCKEVVSSAKRGYRWQASLEVTPDKIETVDKGAIVNVNGRSHRGPVYVTRTGVFKGFAFVSHGADDNTTVSVAASPMRTLAAQVAKLSPDLRHAVVGAATLVTLEQLFGINGDAINAAIRAADIAPAFTHCGVHHYSLLDTFFAIKESN